MACDMPEPCKLPPLEMPRDGYLLVSFKFYIVSWEVPAGTESQEVGEVSACLTPHCGHHSESAFRWAVVPAFFFLNCGESTKFRDFRESLKEVSNVRLTSLHV